MRLDSGSGSSKKSCLDGLCEFEVEQILERCGWNVSPEKELDVLDDKHEYFRRLYCTARCFKPQGCNYLFQCLEAEFGYQG